MHSKLVTICLLFFVLPQIQTWPLDLFVQETRKSIAVSTFLKDFNHCQITVLTNHGSNDFNFFPIIKQVLQIFYIDFTYGKFIDLNSTKNNLYGVQYVVKKAVCKVNLLFYTSKHRPKLDAFAGIVFASQISVILDRRNNLMVNIDRPSRTVFRRQDTYYLLVYEKRSKTDTIAKLLYLLKDIFFPRHQFWSIGLLPTDQEFIKTKVVFSLWFVTLIDQQKYENGHRDILLNQYICEHTHRDLYICKPDM